MASVIIGDYEYTSLGNGTANVKVVDKSKISYETMLSTVTIDGVEHNVTDLSRCFYMCTNMENAPQLPSSVTNMEECFSNCQALTSSQVIPSSVDNMQYCFYNCINLVGQLEVRNSPTYYLNMFDNTVNEIVIIRLDETLDATTWRTIAAEYENVYFEGEGAPDPKLVMRTIEKGFLENNTWRYDANGTWIKYEMVPELSLITVNRVKDFQVKVNNESISFTKDWTVSDGVYTNYLEYNDLNRITTQVQVIDRFNKVSNVVSKKLAGTFVMLDFIPGGQGMSIGRIGTRDGLDIQIPTTIGEGLIPPLNQSGGVDLSNYQLIIGKYNDTDSQYSDDLFVIGNGVNNANRKNTFTIDQNGYMNVVNGFEIKVQNNALMTFKPGDISIGQLDGTQSYANIKYNSFQLFDIEAAELIYTATKFDGESTYQVGDIIKFVNFFTEEPKEYYRCKIAVTTPGPWDSTCWERIYPNPYFSISDLRDKNGKVNYSEKIVIDENGDGKNVVTVSYPILTLGNTYINGVEEGIAQWTDYNNKVTFPNRTLYKGDIVVIEYTIQYNAKGIELLKSYNLGYRNPSSSIGQLSLIDGFNNEASGKFSYAGGFECEASGSYSYARGQNTKARGLAAHAEGSETIASDACSHAEGDGTTAEGYASHAEGYETTAGAQGSHAGGVGTYALNKAQYAIGLYNKIDLNNEQAFIIGNGTEKNARSNAFTVSWDGNVKMALNTKSTQGLDYELKTALDGLGWQDCYEDN